VSRRGFKEVVPLIVSVIQIGRDRRLERPFAGGLAIAAVVLSAAIVPQAVLRSDSTFGRTPLGASAPLDARALDYQATGLLTNVRQSRPPMWPGGAQALLAWRDPARVFVAQEHPGFSGFAAGYGVYVVDVSGRGDPLLARLAPAGASLSGDTGSWNATRPMPEGYLPSLPSHDIQLADPALASLYSRIRLITRGSLWDWHRLLAAGEMLVRPPDRAEAPTGPRRESGS